MKPKTENKLTNWKQVPSMKKGKAIHGKTHKSSGMVGLVQRRLMEVRCAPSPVR